MKTSDDNFTTHRRHEKLWIPQVFVNLSARISIDLSRRINCFYCSTSSFCFPLRNIAESRKLMSAHFFFDERRLLFRFVSLRRGIEESFTLLRGSSCFSSVVFYEMERRNESDLGNCGQNSIEDFRWSKQQRITWRYKRHLRANWKRFKFDLAKHVAWETIIFNFNEFWLSNNLLELQQVSLVSLIL